jgi:3-methylcrotonyl-CoA carboxylase alpha subunit
MEMNTRLQVEHPVTEAITGLDLVEWQLRVAAGEPLPLTQERIPLVGHAIEVRVCAEDPARNYLPSIGTVSHVRFPADARVETALRPGDAVTPDYDPMIAKIIVHAPGRASALARLRAALGATEIVGVQTNLALLAAIAADPDFAAGAIDTGFLPRHPDLAAPNAAVPPAAIAAAALACLAQPAPTDPADPHSPWAATDAWRLNLPGAVAFSLRCNEESFAVTATPEGDAWRLSWPGASHLAHRHDGLLRLDDATLPVTVAATPPRLTVLLAGRPHAFDLLDPLAAPSATTAGAEHVVAPIPGRVASVLCKPGDTVARGQPLLVLEAMKMEMTLSAAMDGTVAAVRCAVGDMVQEGADLVDFAAEG